MTPAITTSKRIYIRAAACLLLAAACATNDAHAGSFEPVLSLSSLDGTNGFVLEGIDEDDNAGNRVAVIGDVNDDGHADLAIAASAADVDGNIFAGEVYVVFGTGSGFPASFDLSNLDGTNGFVATGGVDFERVGSELAAAGDFNDDGIDDFLIGAFGGTTGVGAVGKCYLVFGRSDGFPATLPLASLDGTNGLSMNGIGVGDGCGHSCAGLGDLNGDGIDDVIIGAEWADPGGRENAGQCYIVYGNDGEFAAELDLSTLNGSNGFTVSGILANDHVGRSVAAAGDLNGDGLGDIAIGASYVDSFAGTVYVLFGSKTGFASTFDLTSLDGTNGLALLGEDDDQVGASVSAAGDINADGIDDLIVGATTSSRAGMAFVIFGRTGGSPASLRLANLDGTNGFVFVGTNQNDNCGQSVASAGDLNADGVDDVIIGAYSAEPEGASPGSHGECYVIFGRTTGFPAMLDAADLSGTSGFLLAGGEAGDRAGYDVASAGDVNGDGIGDIIIGAIDTGPGEIEIGEAYVVYGRLGCLTGSADKATGQVADVLFVNASTGDAVSRDVLVRAGERLWATIVTPPAGGNGKFVMHANVGRPSVATQTALPFNVGMGCFPLLLPAATPIGIWNNLGKAAHLGDSQYLDGSPAAAPDPAPTVFLFLVDGDDTNLPAGTVVTLQGAIVDPNSISAKRVSATNGITIEIVP